MKNPPYKRKIYTTIYSQIINVQSSYREIIRQLVLQLANFIPKTEQEIKKFDILQQQIETAYQNIDKIEEIKFFWSLALLTDGALVDETEISKAILLGEEMLEVAHEEASSNNAILATWADNKIEILNSVLQVLYDIIDHKIDRKIGTGEIEIQ